MNICTHDQIDLAAGLLGKTTLLYGGNALQTISVTRNTPRNPNQAVGYLGIVDYNRGIATSDVSLDTILVESCSLVDMDATGDGKVSSLSRYANKQVDLLNEEYSMTSFAMALAAGSPVTANYGWITAGSASYLASKTQPASSDGTQFAVVMGDDEHGLVLVATWGGTAPTAGTIPIIKADGTAGTVTDSGLPAGVQSINLAGNINRDNVLDVRSSRPIQFVTQYPLRITMDMEVYQLPGTTDPNATAPRWNDLKALEIKSRENISSAQKTYAKITGLAKQTEGESVSVGRYLAYTVNFEGSELYFPITPIDSTGAA